MHLGNSRQRTPRRADCPHAGSRRKLALEILIVLAGALVIVMLLHLPLPSFAVLAAAGCVFIPLFERERRREKRAFMEYEEVTDYMEQLMCSYKRWGHLGNAWEDCLSICGENSGMKKALLQAVHCLRTGEGADGEDLVRSACMCINRRYDSRRLHLFHEFLCRAEKMGGSLDASLDILLDELQMWKKRNAMFQTHKRLLKMECALSSLLAVGMCCFSRMIMPFDMDQRLVSSPWYQISSVAVIVLLLVVLFGSVRKLTGSWLDVRDRNEKKAKELASRYQMLQRASEQGSALGIRAHMAKKYCSQEIGQEFPYWLLTVTLYLQQETVYQALIDSLSQIRGLFHDEVKRLVDELYNHPSSLKPFQNFFRYLDRNEIRTGMKILYSAGNREYADVSRQVHFLVEENSFVMDRCEQEKYEAKTAGMGFLKQLPMILAGGKVIMDMAVLFVFTMENYIW